MLRLMLAASTVLLGATSAALADGARFTVTVDPALAGPGSRGRLVISLIRPGSQLPATEDPNNAPFWGSPQPMFGVDADFPRPDAAVTIDADADHNFESAADLKPGAYRAAARLITTRLSSNWRNDPGNLFSEPVAFTVTADRPAEVALVLGRRTRARAWPADAGADLVEVRSRLLSDFHGREVMLRAGVVRPVNFDPKRAYAAIYEVPGFGGDHFMALGVARSRRADPLAASAFHIVLDPESPNGHTLFADSANNGPCGRALVEELIPELEKRFPLAARPAARLLRGHSSGGWSVIWLAMTYPQTFGAAWSSAPDPVDFRRFQTVDLYAFASMYRLSGGEPAPDRDHLARLRSVPGAIRKARDPASGYDLVSYRQGDRPVMTIREEARSEDVLGPGNSSGQQWDSWFAVFGPRDGRGRPAALIDPDTGAIDQSVAEHYRKYDIAHLLRTQPEKYEPVFRSSIRIIVGGADNFFLNEAVALLQAALDDLSAPAPDAAAPSPAHGSIRIVPDLDHGSIFRSAEVQAIPGQMLEHLRRHGLAPDEPPK